VAQEHPGVTFRGRHRRIHPGALIGAGTVIVADELEIGEGAVIGAGCDLLSARIAIGAHTRVGDDVRVLAADQFTVGDASVLETAAHITCRSITIGTSTYLGARLQVGLGASMEEHSTVAIGSRCQIAPDVTINPTEPVRIGDDVGISPRVALWTHGYHTGHAAQDGFTGTFAGITIQDGVWLAYDVAVMPGVTVGAHTQVAARALVNRSLPARVLAAGVPATVKRELSMRPLDAGERTKLVKTLLHTWLDRLTFKGLTVTPREGEETWQITNERSNERWTLSWRHRENSVAALELIPYGTPAADPVKTMTFCFDEVRLSGELDRLGHDLRDYCRRQSWFFDYGHNSAGLMPERFARLIESEAIGAV
jgi:acetyltransferase-like isoleucine patch superfamily enzyme